MAKHTATQSKKRKKGMADMSIQFVTEALLDDPMAAEKLRLVDDYILQKRRMGQRFVLPQEHSVLEPIINEYEEDIKRFVAYVRKIRDAVPPRSKVYVSLHELYRQLLMRLAQQERRERAARAIGWLERVHPGLSFVKKRMWLRKLEQKWGRERMEYMAIERRKKGDRLSRVEQDDVLQQFWAEVDDTITQGELPNP